MLTMNDKFYIIAVHVLLIVIVYNSKITDSQVSDSKECLFGYYGPDCDIECKCNGPDGDFKPGCNATSGECTCAAGWKGAGCNRECTEKEYGENCAMTCNCTQDEVCDRLTGCRTVPLQSVTNRVTQYTSTGHLVEHTTLNSTGKPEDNTNWFDVLLPDSYKWPVVGAVIFVVVVIAVVFILCLKSRSGGKCTSCCCHYYAKRRMSGVESMVDWKPDTSYTYIEMETTDNQGLYAAIATVNNHGNRKSNLYTETCSIPNTHNGSHGNQQVPHMYHKLELETHEHRNGKSDSNIMVPIKKSNKLKHFVESDRENIYNKLHEDLTVSQEVINSEYDLHSNVMRTNQHYDHVECTGDPQDNTLYDSATMVIRN